MEMWLKYRQSSVKLCFLSYRNTQKTTIFCLYILKECLGRNRPFSKERSPAKPKSLCFFELGKENPEAVVTLFVYSWILGVEDATSSWFGKYFFQQKSNNFWTFPVFFKFSPRKTIVIFMPSCWRKLSFFFFIKTFTVQKNTKTLLWFRLAQQLDLQSACLFQIVRFNFFWSRRSRILQPKVLENHCHMTTSFVFPRCSLWLRVHTILKKAGKN